MGVLTPGLRSQFIDNSEFRKQLTRRDKRWRPDTQQLHSDSLG